MTYDDYLRLVGLLKLAADHRKVLEWIERSACALTGEEKDGHTSDIVMGGYDRTAAQLLELLGIAVPTPATTPEDAARQAAGAMRIAKQFDDLREE
jgi:hypothetical protein